MATEATTWEEAKALNAIGDTVACVIKEHRPFGILVSLGQLPFGGVIERIRMDADGYHTPDEYPAIGSVINATVLGYRDYSQQVELAMPRKGTESERQTQTEELVEVGLRIGDDGRFMFFGVDGVNELLASGKVVIRIEEGRAIMLKNGESQSGVKMQLRGFSVLVVVSSR